MILLPATHLYMPLTHQINLHANLSKYFNCFLPNLKAYRKHTCSPQYLFDDSTFNQSQDRHSINIYHKSTKELNFNVRVPLTERVGVVYFNGI